MVIGLVSAGIGITFVPSSAKKLFNLDAYRNMDQIQLNAEWVIAYRKDNHNPLLKHFIHISNCQQTRTKEVMQVHERYLQSLFSFRILMEFLLI